MNLQNLLELEKFSYLTLLTTKGRLDKNIETIESTETPDVHNYISKNSLVITTAMSFKEDQKELIEFVDHLLEKNAVGLAIKVSRFLIELDEEIISHCNKIGFPLLLIPNDITLGTLYTDVLSELWNTDDDSLTFASNTQRIFSSVLLQKPNFSFILHTLKSITNSEVGLVDPFGNIESCTNYFSHLFTREQLRNIVKSKVHDSGLKYKENIKDTNKKNNTVHIHRINIGLTYPYFLFVLSSSKLDPKLLDFVIYQAIFAIAFTISFKLNEIQFELQKSEMIFRDILQHAREDNEHNLLKLTQRENLQIFESGRHLILHIPDFQKIFPSYLVQEGYTLIYNYLLMKISPMQNYKLIPLIFDHYYLVQSENTNLSQIIRDMNGITKNLKESIDIDMHIAIGPKYFSINNIDESIEDTIDAVSHGVFYKNNKKIKISLPYSYQKLFALIPDNQKEYFYEAKLKDMAKNDETTRELRDTLKAWLLNRGNIKKTAEDLYIHRNTVNYRIDKCKEILKTDLEDQEELYNLEIALTLFDQVES